MRPTTTSSTTRSVVRHPWKSPIPYLFGGLALMLLLIFVALIILVWSHRKRSSSGEDDHEEKPTKPMNNTVFDADQPKIVVIINAGEDKPTHLATPVASTHTCSCSCSSDQV
ncbi:hypothetical protein M0R45_033146 [Rubus argutus]|uniref:Uncharacterized protein n=1 Tax=Rubus argutus TaxID=59490 RepID=A0AAW1WND6_RUBAR